jgi:hypothetical protein
MPYKSAAQAKLMRAVAHNKEFAQKVDIPQSVAKKMEKEQKMAGTKRIQGK